MGKQAATEVLAGAEGTGAVGSPLPHAPTLRLVSSPKRQLILEGMLEAVGEVGYDATSVRTVLDRTGLYRQAFYDNFADKDECYLEAFDFGVAQVEALVVAAAASEGSWEGRLRSGLGALLDFFDAESNVGRALVVEVHAAGREALEKRSAVMGRITEFVDLAREELDEEEPPAIAPEGIIAGIHAVVHSRLATGADEGFRELLPEFMYFAVLPYFGAEVADEEMKRARV
jgi:AcrR family transcriptional regulator